MSENKSKILILEDDETVSAALKEILSRAGHTVLVASRPDDATTMLTSNNIEFLFCDCMLPQMTGIDFITRVRKEHPNLRFKVILMSGIFTDKAFIQESTNKTQALAFLRKPFEMDQVLKLVKNESSAKEETASARKLLYQMFSNPKVTNRQKRKVIESIEEVSGFDLPFLYSLLVETKSSGYLNIYNSDGSVSGISFCNGNIVGVDVDDKTTFLGEMLIQSGYATPADVQTALRDKNNRRIGNYLIQNNQLSPHAFDVILMEQMNIRLVKTIVDEKIRVNFASAEVEMSNPSIDADALSFYLHDWIASKLSLNWLKSFYMIWTGNVIAKSPTYMDDHPALAMSMIKSLDGFMAKIDGETTINKLLDVKGYTEIGVYKAVHFLLTKGLIVFAQRAAFESPEIQMKSLQKIWKNLDGKNGFEIVSYMESGTMGSSLESVLEDFLTTLGPAPEDDRSEVAMLWRKIKKEAEDAVLVAQDSNKATQFRQEAQRSEAENKLKANSLMDDIKKALQYTQYSKAITMVAEVTKLNPSQAQLYLYGSWAKLGVAEKADGVRRAAICKEVEMDMMQIPPDERYDALYPFVSGLFQKVRGDVGGARKQFEKAIAMDASFMSARRELASLGASKQQKQDVFNMDLKQMVSGFFKKK
ncbi:response regulator [Bdellovibrio sp. HCB274]|uniref:response regulator n=1 Tax=Bdellovibrio sp. HCB274 TaxID=3394361 RepID=UPI0039B6E4FC